MYLFFLEEQKSQNRKVSLTAEEESCLRQLLVKEAPTPAHTAVLLAAEQMFPQQYTKLLRSPTQPCTEQLNLDSAEKVLAEKCIPLFRKKMESSHFTIAQLSYNMGKLSGKSAPMVKCSKNGWQ